VPDGGVVRGGEAEDALQRRPDGCSESKVSWERCVRSRRAMFQSFRRVHGRWIPISRTLGGGLTRMPQRRVVHISDAVVDGRGQVPLRLGSGMGIVTSTCVLPQIIFTRT